jgi:hypothetical protein
VTNTITPRLIVVISKDIVSERPPCSGGYILVGVSENISKMSENVAQMSENVAHEPENVAHGPENVSFRPEFVSGERGAKRKKIWARNRVKGAFRSISIVCHWFRVHSIVHPLSRNSLFFHSLEKF